MLLPPLARIALALLPLTIPGSMAGYAQSVILSETTMTTVAASTGSPSAGQKLTLSAAVTTPQGGAVPGGTVQFVDQATLAVLGWAEASHPTIDVSGLAPGRHAIRADYSGTDAFLPLVMQPSQSEELVLTVLEKPQVQISSSHNPSAEGEVVTLTVKVSGAGAIPRGTVTFRSGDAVLAAGVALDGFGMASFTTSALPEGSCPIEVAYHGDAVHAPALSPPLEQNVAAELVAGQLIRDTRLLPRGM